MTTAEAAFRILRHASVTDLAALTISQAAEVAGALSVAVGTFFKYGPKILRQTSASTILPAPVTVSGLSIAAGALEVTTGTPFTTGQRGSSLRIDGDQGRNEIVSTVGWLNPYQGSTGAGKTATVYGDCVSISSRLIERLVSDPWIIDGGNAHSDDIRRLVRVRDEHEMPGGLSVVEGKPEYYAFQPTGQSRGATAQYLFRVWPAPSRQLVIRFEAEMAPDMIDFLALAQTPVELPFSDEHMETIILPLAEAELLASTLMDEVNDRVTATLRAREARAMQMIRMLPKNYGKPAGRIGTRRGY